MKTHNYQTALKWDGNLGEGTSGYQNYSRNHLLWGPEKNEAILASSDPNFQGDSDRYNPEELFLSSIATCHMLWYLHLCASENIIVESYTDRPAGIMIENKDGSGQSERVTLYHPVLLKAESMIEKEISLHQKADAMCFISRSCNFAIDHQPEIRAK